MNNRATALIATAALAAVPVATLASATPAHADTERSGACGNARYELSVDREGAGFEVNADLDGVAPGSRWKVVLRHDGKRFVNKVLTADHEGDLDVERFRADTAGSDTFRLVLKRVKGGTTCATTVKVR